MNQLEQRIWTHQEVMDILAALNAATPALPRPLRWLLHGWSKALANLGYVLDVIAQKHEGGYLWTPKTLEAGILTLIATGKGRAWAQALAAAGVALGLELKPSRDDIGEQVERWLDSQRN